ncbi:MAG: hypothetical protein M1837_006731 [Sclerophora amabilis]|nr:MAG: hypothetical protein M1837_006731 [Sclerophora amabilis]
MKTSTIRTELRRSLMTLALAWPAAAQESKEGSFDALRFIDPLIGTASGGHVFPGATLPFGMAKAVADTNGENQGGFASDAGLVTGFSHMHDSGTGGSASMGNFPIFPQSSCPGDELNRCKFSSSDRAVEQINGTTEAHPGYFGLTLNNDICAQTTVTNHTAIYRFTFPPSGNATRVSPLILVDLNDLPLSRKNGTASVDPLTGRLTGNGTFSPSFGVGTYDLHFCIDFSGADIRETGTWVNNRAGTARTSITVTADGINAPAPLPAGVFTRFEAPRTNNSILARAGVSFISVDKACGNAEHEIPEFDFEATRKAAEKAWREKLSVVEVDAEGVGDDLQTLFWSGLYRTMISPQDYTGENPLWDSEEPYYDSFYCIWDSFRSIHPLLTILDPFSQSRMVRSLIDVYRHEGYLPDCRMSLCKGFTQGGSNADVVIVDSYLKNITGVDWATAYEALLKNAEYEPPNWAVEGRGGLTSWKGLGYIPTDDIDFDGVGPFTRSISRTVEYAYEDFCIAELAKNLGNVGDYEKYTQRALNWANMYRENQSSFINGIDTGFSGFLQPRFPNGTWGYQDPIFCSPLLHFTSCYLNPGGRETYEGSSWLYTFFVPQDMAALIAKLGGPESFTSRLDYLHESGLLYMGDEQAFLTVFQYHYVGRPGLSSVRAHSYVPSQFNSTIAGIPGNDDSGAMGSFVALTMMGMWPVSGQDVYLITPPFFKEVRITNPVSGKIATVRNIGFDSGSESFYIQSATRDGKPWTRNWIDHDFFWRGGVLELVLGRNESDWGTHEADLPPSLSTGGL